MHTSRSLSCFVLIVVLSETRKYDNVVNFTFATSDAILHLCYYGCFDDESKLLEFVLLVIAASVLNANAYLFAFVCAFALHAYIHPDGCVSRFS